MIGDLLDNLISEGYVYLKSYYPNVDTQAIAARMGNILSSSDFSTVQSLSPKKEQSTNKNTYSGNFGLGEFPLHTDMAHWFRPPRYFLLRAKIPAPGVATTILHHRHFLEGVSYDAARRAIFQPRRKLENKAFLLRLIDGNIFRWDQIFLMPKNEEAKMLYKHMNDLSRFNGIKKIFLDSVGDTLLIDNWKVMHGRTAIPQSSFNRVIERVYISEIY